MKDIFHELGIGIMEEQWILLPMLSSSSTTSSTKSNLKSSDLGTKLADALNRVRQLMEKDNKHDNHNKNDDENDDIDQESSKKSQSCQITETVTTSSGPVVFLGMDSPELPIDEIIYAMKIASASSSSSSDDGIDIYKKSKNNGSGFVKKAKAYLNPACDGGYGMLCVPPHAPTSIFHGIRWSHPLTAMSQLKALSDHGIDTVIGSLMDDIDEADDCISLVKRLCEAYSVNDSTGVDGNGDGVSLSISKGRDSRSPCGDILSNRSALHLESHDAILSEHDESKEHSCPCPKTFETLQDLGLINKVKVDADDDAPFDEEPFYKFKPNLDKLVMTGS